MLDLDALVGSLPLSRDLSVGERIRAYRENRGLTREQLAQLVGRSEHWLYLIERGLRQPARYSDLTELGRVLQTTVADLIGRQEAARPERGGDQLGPLRAILAVPDSLAPVPDDLVDLDELRADVRQLDRMAWASRLDELTPVLPEVLGRARAASRQHDGDSRRAALALLAQVYRGVSAVCKRGGDLGQARIAVERSWSAAGGSDDPTMRALAARVVSAFLLQEGRAAEARDVAVAAMSDLGHAFDVPGIAAWGSLLLAAAIGEARLGNAQGSVELLDEAESGAIPLVDNHRNWTTFGSINVAIHRISAAVDLDQPEEAVRVASRVGVDSLPAELAERRARFCIDVARSEALRGDLTAAVDTLLRSDQVMPGELRRHVAVRELVRDGLRRQRRRSVDSDLARLARTVGVLPTSR
jgi:transcriptional regulator with XRE-family HTH domain